MPRGPMASTRRSAGSTARRSPRRTCTIGSTRCAAKVRWVDSEALTKETLHDRLEGAAGILVPGGFGHRGIEGKVLAAHFARDHDVPYLGLCLGLQCAVIEFAREVTGSKDANSTEFDMFTTNPVIDFMPD